MRDKSGSSSPTSRLSETHARPSNSFFLIGSETSFKPDLETSGDELSGVNLKQPVGMMNFKLSTAQVELERAI